MASGARRRPSGTLPPGRSRSREGQEVRDQESPVLGQDRLGVELHTPLRLLPMRHPHHHAAVRALTPRGLLEYDGQGNCRERVVADRAEVLRDALEDARTAVSYT